ncbi:MAG: hypothetical protein JWM82_3902 [Myxococcales bacterium]|jgi:hypothetical protein|nr:hypothetical protein [Myxococcales bacterium]
MKKTNSLARGLGVVALVAGALAARPAEARLIDLHAGGYAGGLTGWGSTSGTPDFFDRRKGPGVGVAVGVKLLIFDLSVNFTQLFDSGGRAGTLTQALVGINFDIPVGNQLFTDGIEKGKSRNVLRPIYNVGFAIGTPEPVKPPLDLAQISARGLVSYMGLSYEHFLNEFIGVGAEADFGYHYFVGGGKSMDMTMATTNTLSTHSSGYQLAGFGTVTFHLGY